MSMVPGFDPETTRRTRGLKINSLDQIPLPYEKARILKFNRYDKDTLKVWTTA